MTTDSKTSAYRFYNDKDAAEFLAMSVKDLVTMRVNGRGPKYFMMPNGRIRYTNEQLQRWAMTGVHLIVKADSNILPFPNSGVVVCEPEEVYRRSCRLRRLLDFDPDELEFVNFTKNGRRWKRIKCSAQGARRYHYEFEEFE